MREQRNERVRSLARHHATAVAAMVLSGEPKIDEPLIRPWARTLAHHQQVPPRHKLIWQLFGSDEALEKAVQDSTLRDYADATASMYPIIMNGAKEERARFTEIFSTAPIWLLTYTFTKIDAKLLEFDLPDLSAAPQWGEIGHRGLSRWPRLPVGVMTEGDPIATQEIDPSLSPEDCAFAIQMLVKPEDEWTRMERRRMLEIGPRLGWTPARG
jgi:hypothetical protein